MADNLVKLLGTRVKLQLVAGANLMGISWTDCQTHANNSLVQQLATHFRQSATDRGSQTNNETIQTDKRTAGQRDSWTFTVAVGSRQSAKW